jgi:threonylcarbamoyladenosine tRNA methylthiotransferase MtaB
MPTAAFYTLGCKLNFAETSTIARQLVQNGFEKIKFEEGADVYVINTCSVTDHADRKCKRVVAEALRKNPEAKVVVVGCYAQLKPDEIAKIPGVDLVLGAQEKFNISEFLPSIKEKGNTIVSQGKIKDVNFFIPSYSIGDRTRTFLKVQDGCDYVCAFCTIPLARGTSRNQSIEKTVEVAKEIAATDVKEIVLSGVNIGDFGKSTGESFSDLLKALDIVDGIERIRISSIEPNLLTDEIIEWCSTSNRIVPHFHIPLQSGNDKILKMMRRRYLREVYSSRVAKIRSVMPDACIGVDVIVGFPGETEEDFLDTYNFLNELDVSYFHVFTYSERAKTTAIKMEGKVHISERKRRNEMLAILSEKKRRKFYEDQIGKTFSVLFESENDGGKMHGFTENYVKVSYSYDPVLINEIQKVKLKNINEEGLMEIVPVYETVQKTKAVHKEPVAQ